MDAQPTPAAEIKIARTTADEMERRLSCGLVSTRRRRTNHTIVRALRFYAEALGFEIGRDADPAAIKAAGGRGCSPSVPNTDQASHVTHVSHAPMDRKWSMRDVEESFQRPEEGLRSDG
jgi:hypothetical protein